ncbi:organic cation transporter protein-like isoform X2 [Plodia interpunctella]|uniref:organic cation transporter protein-like isoform X2 n=1 Tax=Plodia interpunctella TaxID=58824 RepID=UPI002368B4E6|nr:organic cation transporter protein-like isoform X2 [Plodia interpunctella]
MSLEKNSEEVTIDDILKILGPFGRFNLYNYVLILFPVLLSGLYSSVYNFESLDLKYRCEVPECLGSQDVNFTIPHDPNGNPYKCLRYAPFSNSTGNGTCSPHHFDSSMAIPCESYVYLEHHSIVKEFDLACQDWKRSLVGTVHNAGFFVSIPLTGLLSDKFGRRVALIFAAVSNGVFGVIRALSVNYEMFIVFEFLEPAFGGGVYTACFVLAMELVGPKGRVFVSLLFNTMFIIGGVCVTLLSWYLENWRYLVFLIYTPSVFIFVYIWTLTESFRWYFSKGRYEEGLQVLMKSEKINNVSVPRDHYEQVEKHATQQREARKFETLESNQSSFKQMFTSIMIWKRLFICSFLWISSTLVYYGLSINAIELSGNSYLNYIVVLVIEAPANVCKLIFLDRFGRKKVIATAFFLTALILINYGFVPAGVWSLVMYLGGKFFITLAYNSLYVFAAEVFPTNYRTTLLAMCSTIGRTGSTVAPQTPLLARYYEYLPTMLFGIMAGLSAFFVLLLPETNNMKLPDSLREAQEQDKRPGQTDENNTSCKTSL